MRPALAAALLFLCAPRPAAAEPLWAKKWEKVQELVAVLERVPEGKALLAQARQAEPRFEALVAPGSASFTERIYRASYSAESGRETVRRRAKVTIHRGHSLADASLDLAHELQHFLFRPPVDPFAPGFSLASFVGAGIEGPGGELPAFEAECRLYWALEKAHPAFPAHRYCGSFRKDGSFDREAARLAYWAVGRHKKTLPASLGKEVKELSEAEPRLTAGLGAKPYPVSLAAEFESLRKATCANNRFKYRKIVSMGEGGRERGSASVREEIRRMEEFQERHCR